MQIPSPCLDLLAAELLTCLACYILRLFTCRCWQRILTNSAGLKAARWSMISNSHKMVFARDFWPKKLNSIPFLNWRRPVDAHIIAKSQHILITVLGSLYVWWEDDKWVCGNDLQLYWVFFIYPVSDFIKWNGSFLIVRFFLGSGSQEIFSVKYGSLLVISFMRYVILN